MLLLFETAAGYALFTAKDKLKKSEDIWSDFEELESAKKVVKLKAFAKFKDTAVALEAATAVVDSKLSKGLKKFLKKHAEGESVGMVDSKLAKIVKDKLGIDSQFGEAINELTRGVRYQLQGLIAGLAGTDLRPMALGLSHSLSRYKLKFSPDKVDTMVVQAIGLLDDLDKELNTYAMRVREWYGWHFPEMAKIVADNVEYAKAIKLMGPRETAVDKDFSSIGMEEQVESQLKEAAIISMGTEVSEADMDNVMDLCDQVIALSEYRAQLFDYLKARMAAIAPNLTVLVGELVGARLISHAGSLMGLAKQPASTIQILGAEKALFRALKTKANTPKYGLIYHASLVGQSAPKHKGKVSRVLAAKCALAIRVDALADETDASLGIESRAKVEARIRQLEGRALAGDAAGPITSQPAAYDRDTQGGAMAVENGSYAADVDVVPGKSKKRKAEDVETEAEPEPKKKKSKKSKEADADAPKKKKKKSKSEE